MIPYGKKRAHLSSADKELAVTLFLLGESHADIAERIHCSASNIWAITRPFRPAGKPRPRNHPRRVTR